MAVLWNAFYFIVALGILVTFHEFGHFWVARKLGVKVLTFSVGFGKPLWQRVGKDGVRYVIAAIPLGGYVKMLDEREAPVSEALAEQAFNRQSVWARIAIVVAGPLANFILAVALYWWIFIAGIGDYNTRIGAVESGSIAAEAGLQAGDRVTGVDGAAVETRSQLIKRFAVRMGDSGEIILQVRGEHGDSRRLALDIADWQVDPSRPDLMSSIGIKHPAEVLAPVIAQVSEAGPAERAGIQPGDRIVSFDGQAVNLWKDLRDLIRDNAGRELFVQINRQGELLDISVVIGSQNATDGQTIGFLGIGPEVGDLFFTRQGTSVIESFSMAVAETTDMVVLSAKLFAKLVTGDLSLKSLSGPIAIAEGAGSSASAGLIYFLSFVAMISVNLGFINLLPIPVLDGGHLLYFSIEALTGKPLSEKVQEVGLQIGMLIVFTLMAFAIFSDLSRF